MKYFPLTKEQLGLWFEYKLNPNATNYNAYIIHKIKGDLDINRFVKAEDQVKNQ